MITKPIIFTLATSLLFCSGCAAKNRWFSRRDYSEMQDPFMESEAVADAGNNRESTADTAGRAKLDRMTAETQSPSSRPGGTQLPGPKPILRTGVEGGPAARTSRIANASYPNDDDSERSDSAGTSPTAGTSATRSYSGPELSDFLSRKRAEAAKSSSSTATAANEARDPLGSRPSTAIAALPPSFRTEAAPKLSEEAASFSNFLQQNPNTVNTAVQRVNAASQQATQTVQDSEAEVGDFAAWAEQRKSNWTKEGTEAATNSKSFVENEFSTAARQARQTADNAVTDFSEPDFDAAEAAEPLIQHSQTPPTQQKAEPGAAMVFEEPKKHAPAAEVNPFDNPFDFGEADPVAAKPNSFANPASSTSSPAPRKALDDSFQMDNGWKLAHITRP